MIRLVNFLVPTHCTGNSGCFLRGERAAKLRRYPAFFPASVQCFRVSVIHRTLTWTSTVRTWSFLCVRIHTRVGHTDRESTQYFDSEKLANISYAPQWRGSNLGSWNPLDHEADALPTEPPVHTMNNNGAELSIIDIIIMAMADMIHWGFTRLDKTLYTFPVSVFLNLHPPVKP